MEAVLGQIREAGREWRGDALRAFTDLKFTYEQEAQPEDFFTPYVWQVVCEGSGIGWATHRILLFPLDSEEEEGGGGAAAGGEGLGLPPLTNVDVDESAIAAEEGGEPSSRER